jgi:formate hydrogenlyase subunit 3/multisubunit Na+/H+ antiporter MnhD subunit
MELMTPLFAILCPAIAAPLILLSKKHPNVREGWTMVASIATFSLILSMAPKIVSGEVIECIFFQTIFENIYFGFNIDAFGLIFAITSSSLWILVSLYSIGYMRALNEHAQTRFYFYFCWAIFGAIGVALSANLLTFYVFFEILTVSTYPLVIHDQSPEALSAGHKYFAYLLTGGCFFLFAIMMTYYLTGTTDLTPGGISALGSASRVILIVMFFCYLLAFMKAAWMPFHSWLPTAMIAPTPVSALLHAVAVVKAGVFGIVRVVCYVYGVDLMHGLGLWLVLVCIAGFTMIVGSFFAIAQDNLKRRLAYSTISQLSYIILGAALLTSNGIRGAMLHIPFHGYMKITLFMCAGAIMVATGKKNVSELAGIGKQMPVTMLAFSITAIGMCGIPPVCGFISKIYLCFGAWALQPPYGLIFLAVILISSLLDVIYFFPIIYTAFFRELPEGERSGTGEVEIKEAPIFVVVPLVITAIVSVIFFLHPNTMFIFDLVKTAVIDLGFSGGI